MSAKSHFAIYFDDRYRIAVSLAMNRVGIDIDVVQLEAELPPFTLQKLGRLVTERAVRTRPDDDANPFQRPLSPKTQPSAQHGRAPDLSLI